MKDITFEQLKEYYMGRCTAREEYEIQMWIAHNADSEKADALLHKIFMSIDADDQPAAQAAFDRFCRQIGQSTDLKKRRQTWRRRLWQVIGAAACLIGGVVGALLYSSSRDNDRGWVECYAPYGCTEKVVLSDNSVIWLNSGSRITYPRRFTGRERQVFIEGEVFAEIAKQHGRPFVIKTGEVDVTVLGTTFNLRSFAEDDIAELALVEGAVRLDINTERHNQQIDIAAGEIVRYERSTETVEKHTFHPESYQSFAQGGGMLFYDQKLSDITAQLQRRFNIEIVMLNRQKAAERYFAYFTNDESLENILKTINADGRMKITVEDGIMFIK